VLDKATDCRELCRRAGVQVWLRKRSMGKKRKAKRPPADPSKYGTTSLPKQQPTVRAAQPEAEAKPETPETKPLPEPLPEPEPEPEQHAAASSPMPPAANAQAGATEAPRDATPPPRRSPLPSPPRTGVGPAFGDTRSVSLSAANEDYVLGVLGGAAQLPLQLDRSGYVEWSLAQHALPTRVFPPRASALAQYMSVLSPGVARKRLDTTGCRAGTGDVCSRYMVYPATAVGYSPQPSVLHWSTRARSDRVSAVA
jgi:hypothetical protein